MRFTPEDISLLVGLVSAMLAIYGRFKTEILMQEKRMTVMEKDNEFLIEFKNTATRRLNNHEEQTKAILVLAEQVKNMGDDVRDLKRVIMKEN